MDQVVLCPACGDGQPNLFAGVRNHLLLVHGIQVTQAIPGGFSCGICGRRFFTYPGWKDHTRIHHLHNIVIGENVNDNQNGNEGNGNVNGNQNEIRDENHDDGNHEHEDSFENDSDYHSDESSEWGEDDIDELERLPNDRREEDDMDRLEILPNGRRDPKHAAVNMLVNMRSVPAMTREGVRRAVVGAELVLKVKNQSLQADVAQFLNNIGQLNSPAGLALLEKFEKESPFCGLKSKTGQISGIKTYYRYIAPVSCNLEDRLDQRLEDDAQYEQVPVHRSYEYVSVTEILKLIVRKPTVMEYVNSLRPSQDGMLRCYTDGDQYRRSAFFQQFPHAFQVALYYDDVDPARSLGSKSGLHSLGNFQVEVLNLPPCDQSSLSSIHPIILANSQDCKGTFDAVLHRFVQEMTTLQEEGVRVYTDNGFVEMRAKLVAVKGDAKAVHELLGFLGCGARHFCPLCMISRQQLHQGNVMFGENRTPELTDWQLQRVAQNDAFTTECGIRHRTCLNNIPGFRVENNRIFDLQHDGPEGVIMMIIRLALRQFICEEGLFSVQELNQRIFAFQYGKQNSRDKPTPNFSFDSLAQARHVHNQKMNSVQTLVLLRALPFLLDSIGEDGAGVPENHDHLQMLLLVLRIYQIALAPCIPRNTLIPYLRRLLHIFFLSWYNLYPGVDPINKFHHLMHLCENILEMGPMKPYACFRNEGKNCPVKRHVATCNNFINPSKTAMEQVQVAQAKVWGTDSPDIEREVKFVQRTSASVGTLPIAVQLLALGYQRDDELFVARAVTVHGFEYRRGEFVMYSKASDNPDDLPRFGRISTVIDPQVNDWILLGVQAWHTNGLVERFNSYSISLPENAPTHLINITDLPLHPPISRWRDYSSDATYLCLKYLVF